VFIRVVVRWRKGGFWDSVGVGSRILIWIGGGVVAIVVDGDVDDDEGGEGVVVDVEFDVMVEVDIVLLFGYER
jgi:hypothetical protein